MGHEPANGRAQRWVTVAALAVIVISALLVVAAAACSDPCEYGTSRCEGKNLRTCGTGCENCDVDWLPAVACEGACVAESDNRAFCSIKESPDPLCGDRRGYCDADLQIGCRSGYAISQNRCEPLPGTGGKAECVEIASGLACHAARMPPPVDGGGPAD
jgi:hypothetical protein